MKINFYDAKCQTIVKKELFGLCDDEDKTPTYISLQPKNWNATVLNPTLIEITHTAIDYCIELMRENGEMDNRCDCMLTYTNNIIFIELKNKGSDWISEGINQIEATIKNFKRHHNLARIKHKRAFVANKKHPKFHVVNTEIKRKFWDKYQVRINVDSRINIK